MSGRGGIYKGPNGEKLYGDGREVKAEPSPAPPAERVIEVAPQEEIPLPGVEMISRVTMMPIDMVQTVLEDGSCSSGMDVERYAHAAYHFAAELVTAQSALTAALGERDRLKDLLSRANYFVINSGALGSTSLHFKIVDALKPVSDLQPEGETK